MHKEQPGGHPPPRHIRIMTYNVHSCRGTDGRIDPARIAEVVARARPDIAALQEVDVGRARSGGFDQARLIAAHLNMEAHFHPALHLADEQYGDAILTALPSRLVRAAPLPSLGEPRGAIWVSVDIGGTRLQVINTHLGLRRRERMAQVAALLGPGWLGSAECRDNPTVLVGDFNAVPTSAPYRNLARHGRDVQLHAGARPKATFPSRFPLLRLDHIFIGEGIEAVAAEVPSDLMARTASDHLPLSATIVVPVPANVSPSPAPSRA
ncbi:MAG: endonuclease/exonuclease/phosphatase family protein [Aquamicrobium sp.]|uniref:endonuclease/exonuclease/phosphatase family protein n=1 Tax=Aquamicrobium sp. TaxID=1872579 RepID=UPI00349E54D1|nr:endonuclease/exonuclease/phosphatase family protein [Aquamicrobium sp.]